jgi:hypothetical protein
MENAGWHNALQLFAILYPPSSILKFDATFAPVFALFAPSRLSEALFHESRPRGT